MALNDKTDYKNYSYFIRNYKAVFVKPLNGSFGKNARIIKYSNNELYLKNEFEELKKDKWIVEELIIQAPAAMRRCNVSSVNTVRIPSRMSSKGVEILAPVMRCGCTGSIIDNGGIYRTI